MKRRSVLRRSCGRKGGSWIDAPVSGGQVGAEAGNLTIMCGGEEVAFNRVRPVLDVVGEKVTLMGESGAGAGDEAGKSAHRCADH